MQDFEREQKNPPYQSKAELGAGASPYIVKFTNKLIERDWSLITKKAMTGNARHGDSPNSPSVSYLWAGAKKSALPK